MNFELSNKQEHFWQWDTGQSIILPIGIPTVHFKWGGQSIKVTPSDGVCPIPDELLQVTDDLIFYTYNKDHTIDGSFIKIYNRPKPDGYAYTPTEIKTWEQLDERIKALEKGGGIAGVSSVNGQTGAVEITAKGLGALTEDDLQGATNAALAQAKASGEFDGAPGVPGTPGTDGYSPTVTVEQTDTGATITATDKAGTTTATVKNGSPGAPGTNGTTPQIGDNGNWYLDDTDTGKPSRGPAGAGLDVTGATVGQIVKIAAVDDNGVPTAWTPGDIGKWEKIKKISLDESVEQIVINGISDYRKILLLGTFVGAETNDKNNAGNSHFEINGTTYFYSPAPQQYNGVIRYLYSCIEIFPEMKMHTSNMNNDNSFQSNTYLHKGWFGDGAPINILKISAVGLNTSGAHLRIGAGSTIELWGVRA